MLGAAIVVPLQQYANLELGVSGWSTFAYAAVLLAVLVYLPRGIMPTAARRVANTLARRRGSGPAGELAETAS